MYSAHIKKSSNIYIFRWLILKMEIIKSTFYKMLKPYMMGQIIVI